MICFRECMYPMVKKLNSFPSSMISFYNTIDREKFCK